MKTFLQRQQRAIRFAIGLCAVATALTFGSTSLQAQGYVVSNLVSDIPDAAVNLDFNLANAWGLALLPNDRLVVNSTEEDLAGIYKTDGTPTGDYIEVDFAPTGVVVNHTDQFKISDGGPAQASDLIFVTEEGTILGWNSHLDSSAAVLAVDNSEFDVVYKGADVLGNHLFAADFRGGVVDVYNGQWNWRGAFTDSHMDAGYAPFNVAVIDGLVYVTFAKQLEPDLEDDEPGPGNGFVDVFNPNGRFIRRLISNGVLNSPWGLAKAPANFGEFSNALLVGNFGDGTINAFNIKTGAFIGTLSTPGGDPIVIDGLWGLQFGTTKTAKGKKVTTLFFTSGLNGESDGLVGSIRVNK